MLSSPAPEVTFEIWGPEIDPETITRVLGVSPDESCVKGPYEVMDRDGALFRGTSPSGSWLLRTGERVRSSSPAAHMEYVLDLLRSHLEELKPIAAAAELSLFLRLPAETPTPYPHFGHFESAARSLGLRIDFDAIAEPKA